MTPGTILRREHVVAAGLVGTVVVVVGFASGLGLAHPATAGAQSGPGATAAPSTPPPAAVPGQDVQGGGSAPVNYVGTPIGAGGIAAPPILPPPDPATTPTRTSPTTTPTTTTPPTSTGQPTCQPGLLTALLGQVDTAVSAVPVVGSVARQLTGTLAGTCTTPTTTTTPTTGVPGLLSMLIPTGAGS